MGNGLSTRHNLQMPMRLLFGAEFQYMFTEAAQTSLLIMAFWRLGVTVKYQYQRKQRLANKII